jgi:hypothetical protein
MECVWLRIQDIDLEINQIGLIRDKGPAYILWHKKEDL